MSDKIKILTISDHPLVSSGVGIQTKHIIEGLLATGRYQFRSFGGAMKHADYRPQKLEQYGDDWIIYPVNGYGDENMMREALDVEKPDAVWFMTDPRFYGWLANMSDEIRDRGIPLLYNHIWDEKPTPIFNKPFYDSCDFIGCISKLTHDIVEELGHNDFEYIPHSIDYNDFKPKTEKEILELKKKSLGKNAGKFVFFYNSRNARRKMTSDVVRFFKEFLDEVGHDKAFLLMHTDPFDKEGANLVEVAKLLGLSNEQIAFSSARLPPEEIVSMYNIADTTLCISNNEGFGLSSLESLACGTPVISVRTGGLQDQNINEQTGKVYGVSIEPKTKSLTGSQDIYYIFDCRCTNEDILEAYMRMYHTPAEDRRKLGIEGSEYVRKIFRFDGEDGIINKWDKAITRKISEFKNDGYSDRIKFKEI